MVDPKRHINVLSEEDQLFLNECEEEFKDRFTEDDTEFQAYCAQPSSSPPVLEPWQNRNHHGGGGGGGGGRGRGRFQHHYHHNNRNRDYRDRPYGRDSGHHHGNRYNNNNNNNRDSNNRDSNNRYNSDRRY